MFNGPAITSGHVESVSLPTHTFPGQTWFSKMLTSIAHMLSLNQLKEENDRRKYFMINFHARILPDMAGVEPVTSRSPVGRASD